MRLHERFHDLAKRPGFELRVLTRLLLIGVGLWHSGCDCRCGDPPFWADIEDPALAPRSLFEAQVKPELLQSCSCHQITQGGLEPFIDSGHAYSSITMYQNGKFLTAIADQSPLLLKGAHVGPAFTADQKARVLPWLQGEALARGKSGGSPTTSTVAMRAGDFHIGLEGLGMDPLARINFTMSAFGRGYRIVNLKLTAGPTAGIHIKHPRFAIFSGTSAYVHADDSFADVDLIVNPGQTLTIGSGPVLLQDTPAQSSRLALLFEQIDKVNPTGAQVQCKNFAAFKDKVQPRLASCASQCHSPNGSDARSSQASSGFDMSAALGPDDTQLQQLCARALGRINLQDLPKSVLTLQVKPATLGGTSNHPYKLAPEQAVADHESAIQSWGQGE